MNFKLAVVLFMTVCMLASCVNSSDEVSDVPCFKYNFDEIAGYVDKSKLVHGNARSGNYCIGVSPDMEYSLTWRQKMSLISSEKLSHLRVSGFVNKLSDNSDVSIVISIDQNSQTIFWSSIDLKNQNLTKGEWKKIESFFDFPETSGDAEVLIYLWNRDKSEVILDDLEIEFSI